MELAHPDIAQAVADFDHFRENPVDRAQLTVKAFRDVIHGSEEEALAVGRRLARVHEQVRGAGYAASDPQLLLWVHATFVDSLLCMGQRLYGRLCHAEEQTYYDDARKIGEVFGCSLDVQPPTVGAFRDYVEAVQTSLRVTDVGRDLVHAVFWPEVPASRRPLIALYRVACFGSLPPPLRAQFPRPWTDSDRHLFRAGGVIAPHIAPWTDRAFFAAADGNGRGVTATLAMAGIRRSSGR